MRMTVRTFQRATEYIYMIIINILIILHDIISFTCQWVLGLFYLLEALLKRLRFIDYSKKALLDDTCMY
jgi:hypothetical protein